MREIKFRGKTCGDGSRWIYGYLVHNGNFWYIQEGIISHGVEEASIGQFTGLKDREGKEIWEGDIVEFQSIKGEVEFIDGAFEVMRGVGSGTLREGEPITNQYEILGNIYEQPELLTKQP